MLQKLAGTQKHTEKETLVHSLTARWARPTGASAFKFGSTVVRGGVQVENDCSGCIAPSRIHSGYEVSVHEGSREQCNTNDAAAKENRTSSHASNLKTPPLDVDDSHSD